MGAFDISYNDIAGAPLGSGKKKVAPIQAAQGIAAPTAALSSPQLIDARQSITQAPTVQQLVPAQSITQGAESYMRAHQPGDAAAISYPPIMPDATTTPSPVPAMPTPPGIARSMAGAPVQQPAPATLADIRQPNNQAQPMRNQPVMNPVEPPAAAPAPAQTVDDGAGGVYTPGGGAIGPDKQGGGIVSGIANFFRDSAQAARTGVHYDDVKAGRLAADSAGTSNASSGATPNTIADVTPSAGQQSYRPGSAMANALNETDNFPQSRPGDPIAPPQTPQKPGRNADGVITAESVASHSGDLKPGQMRIGDGGFNLADQNEKMARALGYNGTDDFNRQFRLRNDPEAQRIDSMVNNKGGVSAIDDQIKVNQAESGRVANENARQLQVLQQKGIAGDTKAIETLRALSGKPNQATDRFMAVQGGEEIGSDGMTKIKRPGGVFDAQTGRFVEISPQQGGASGADKIKADMQAGKISRDEAIKQLKAMGYQ